MFILIPVTPAPMIEANAALPSRVIDLVIVTAPKAPESSASISPPLAVFGIAPAKVLHGAERVHGVAPTPAPQTHVRDGCALLDEASVKVITTKSKAEKDNRRRAIAIP